MKLLYQKKINFLENLNKILDLRFSKKYEKIDLNVKKILNEVKYKGDHALIKYTKKFDKIDIDKSQILLSNAIRNRYKSQIDKNYFNSFKLAIKNIKNFHKKQFPQNYKIKKNNFTTGLLWNPIESVGLYVPGGKASYPSSFLMNVIPAKIAGVKRIVVTTPSNNGDFNPYLLALLDLFNIKEVYQVGGAQAIAALAYGTETIKPVNKIFGPGNSYVASAKRQIINRVGIDLIAGPSEIVIVADNNNNPKWIASDLIAQAEHDEKSQCILITDDEKFALDVKQNIHSLIIKLSRIKIIKKSLNTHGAILILKSLNDAAKIINIIAPEHLYLANKFSEKIFKKIKNAGGIFLGRYTTEAFGDYIIGTNHILPTSGSAKYSSGLSVLDFMKRSSYVRLNHKGFNDLSSDVIKMASIESLDGHKLSVTIRQKGKK